MYFGAKPDLFRLAKENRKNPTESERLLWKILRGYRKKGFLFRQQHPIDIFIADFYCHKAKQVIYKQELVIDRINENLFGLA